MQTRMFFMITYLLLPYKNCTSFIDSSYRFLLSGFSLPCAYLFEHLLIRHLYRPFAKCNYLAIIEPPLTTMSILLIFTSKRSMLSAKTVTNGRKRILYPNAFCQIVIAISIDNFPSQYFEKRNIIWQ